MNDVLLEMNNLVNKLNRWSYEYHVLNKPTVDDQVYDRCFRDLLELEKQYPSLINTASPTRRVGESIPPDKIKVIHKTPMLSLDNVFNKEELSKWVESLDLNPRSALILEPKVDGLAVSLIYENGVLVRASTRGDGHIGQDITHVAKAINDIPLTLQDLKVKYLEVRGEIYLKKSEFNRINKELAERGEEVYKHPRNLAAGTAQLLDQSIIRSRNLSFIAYDLTEHRHTDNKYFDIFNRRYNTQSKRLEWLRLSGFSTSAGLYSICYSIGHVLARIDQLSFTLDELDVPLDGCVIKINSIDRQDKLGSNNRSPNWAIAYKFPAKEYITNIVNVQYQVGRTGRITPVGVISPTVIDGVTVTMVTFHNLKFLSKQNLGYGDKIKIIRSGEVIPKYLEKVEKDTSSKKFTIPNNCPSCGSKIILKGELSYCTNPNNCQDAVIGGLVHFASRSGFNILYFGKEYIEWFYKRGYLTKVTDFFSFDKQTLMLHPDIKDGQSSRLLKSIEDSKYIGKDSFITALGIPSISGLRAKLLTILLDLPPLDLLERYLDTLDGFGDAIKRDVLSWYSDIDNQVTLSDLINTVNFKPALELNQNHKGIVVLSGKFDISRKGIEKMLAERGYKVGGVVNKSTKYLIVGSNPSSKLDKANKLGIKVVHYQGIDSLPK